MINSMNVYINKLAEKAREQCEEQNIIAKEQCRLEFNQLKDIIEYFGGELIEYKSHEEIQKKSSEIKGNSFMQKTSETGFEIGYLNFSVIDILHELGHVFLELDTMEVGKVRGCGDTRSGIKELEASKWARAFLMPMELFKASIVRNSDKGYCDIHKVAEEFGVDEIQIIVYGREAYIWE